MAIKNPQKGSDARYEKISFHRQGKDLPFFFHIFEEDKAYFDVISRHWHRSIELSYRIEYNGDLYLNGQKKKLGNDQVIMINSCETHEIHRMPDSRVDLILIILLYEPLKALVPEIDSLYFDVPTDAGDLKEILLEFKEVFGQKDDHMYLRYMELYYRLVYTLLHRYAKTRTDQQFPAMTQKWEKDVIQYIYDNYQENLSVAGLAGHFGYSREYFSKLFKKMMGTNCKEFIDRYRLDRSLRLLSDSDKDLGEIWSRVGFSSNRAFHEAFVRNYGVTPLQYKKLHL